MGWRTLSALLVFWAAMLAFPMFMLGVVGAGVLLLLLLSLRDHLHVLATRLRDQRNTRPAPQPPDE